MNQDQVRIGLGFLNLVRQNVTRYKQPIYYDLYKWNYTHRWDNFIYVLYQ